MIIDFTARLLFLTERAWTGLSAADPREEATTSPIGNAATLAGISVVATTAGAALDPGRSVGGVVVHGLTAIVGYEGAVLSAVVLLPHVLARVAPVDAEATTRFGSAAVAPLAISGAFNVLPLWGATWAFVVAGTVLAARAAWIGSHTLLRWTGGARRRALALLLGSGLAPLVASTAARAFFIR